MRYKDTRYEVSSIGGVRNTVSGRIQETANRRTVSIDKNNGERGRKSISQMVATAFIPNPHHYKYVMPINGNRYDNRVENLQWTRTKEPLTAEMDVVFRWFNDDGTWFLGKMRGVKRHTPIYQIRSQLIRYVKWNYRKNYHYNKIEIVLDGSEE